MLAAQPHRTKRGKGQPPPHMPTKEWHLGMPRDRPAQHHHSPKPPMGGDALSIPLILSAGPELRIDNNSPAITKRPSRHNGRTAHPPSQEVSS
ncbi:hypothetical protein GUJ93_ZPchr0001g30086 [Zizania palustris]|uniref:Uncharacterized protein n=1 Tax=Zizania palustris TaxID=103762 RepID=A0A8J5VLE2_ZIZPA|nr:hypothetical protein GUJ93_ZPchr0001g30086 [Zizania palustris]